MKPPHAQLPTERSASELDRRRALALDVLAVLACAAFLVVAAGCDKSSSHVRARPQQHGPRGLSFAVRRGTVVDSSRPNGFSVLMNSLAGTFRVVGHGAGGMPRVAIGAAVGDIDGDGRPDLATFYNSSEDDGTCSYVEDVEVCPAHAYVALNRGDGTFRRPRQVYLDPTSDISAVAIGDLNGDGRPDLAIAYSDYEGENGVDVLLNRGAGRLAAGNEGSDRGGDFSRPVRRRPRWRSPT